MYKCIINSNNTRQREYDIETSSAYKAAQTYGRCEGGEVVSVYTMGGKLISQACYTPEDGGKYYRCHVAR